MGLGRKGELRGGEGEVAHEFQSRAHSDVDTSSNLEGTSNNAYSYIT